MVELFIHIESGEIVNRKGIKKAFGELADGKYLVKIDPFKKRSLPQNAYLHGVVIPLVYEGLRHAGYDEVRTHEDAKAVIKSLFLKRQIPNTETGEVIEIIHDTSKLTTVGFNEFVESVVKWAAEFLNVQIPMPNEQMTMVFDSEVNATIITPETV